MLQECFKEALNYSVNTQQALAVPDADGEGLPKEPLAATGPERETMP